MSIKNTELPKIALYLGYGGLIPFIALSLMSSLGISFPLNLNISIELFLAIYAAVIISFLGAIHWGVALSITDQLNNKDSNTLFLYSVIPSLLAWFSFIFDVKTCLFLLACIVIGCFIIDSVILFKKLNTSVAKSFKKLRLHLTIIVSASLLLATFTIN